MSRGRQRYIGWFLGLATFFVAANVAGLVRPMGLKPFRVVGFPLVWAAWGPGIQETFSVAALAADGLIAVTVSTFVAWLCSRQAPTGVRYEASDSGTV